MIIGRGMISNSMKRIDNENYIFFASGVSNSKENNILEYKREKELLSKYYSENKCLIYFSSYFVGFESYLNQKYYKHKEEMENLIKRNFSYYKIIRLPQVVGYSNNNNTLTNFLFNSISNDIPINVFENTKRNLIDIDDIVSILEYINKNELFLNSTVNLIAAKSFKVEEIIETFEFIFNKKAIKNICASIETDFDLIISKDLLEVYNFLDIKFDELYLEKLIEKYYKRRNS